MLYAIMAELRFKKKVSRDKALAWLKKNIPRGIKAKLITHICHHDVVPFKPCEVEETVEV